MTAAEIKTRLHERIEHLTEQQLKQLSALLDKEFSEDTTGRHLVGRHPVGQYPDKAGEPLKERPIGTMKGMLVYMADDFDAPLDDFKAYMPE